MATITFEDIDHDADMDPNLVQDGYKGLEWHNFFAFNTDALVGTGYHTGTHGGNSIGFNEGGKNARFFVEEGTFTLKSGYFTAAFQEERITLTAVLDGVVIGKKKVLIDDEHQEFVKFNDKFSQIDEVRLATGGENGTQAVLDDLIVTIDDARPEPAAVHDFSRAVPHLSHAPVAMTQGGMLGAAWQDWMLV
jgi:hypothetical protein